MKKIVFIGHATPDGVRLIKIAKILKEKNYNLEFVGWSRDKNDICPDETYDNITTLMRGGGERTRILPILYIWFIIKLFFYLLLKKDIKKKLVYAINSDVAIAVWGASCIKKFEYVYDIWDELAMSHNFPGFIRSLLMKIDAKARKKSAFYIHVDENRVSHLDTGNENYVIIYNSPFDTKQNNKTPEYENSFAVTGWLNNTRGLSSIYAFAKNHPQFNFIVAGEFLQKENRILFQSLSNVKLHPFMPQEQLFELIKNCRGIFSLYDASIPINRMAASNKLYDAMMLSIPVIVNKEILAANFVTKNGVGFVVDYEYSSSWECLVNANLEMIQTMGKKGRELYLNRFEFRHMVESILLPRLAVLVVD